jgi:spore germination protein YaaH
MSRTISRLVAALCLLGMLLGAVAAPEPEKGDGMTASERTVETSPRRPEVTIWAPYAGQLEIDTLTANADLIREVNFFWYELGRDGRISGGVKSQPALERARALGMRVVPSIVNRGFSREAVLTAIATPEARANHIAAIVELVESNGYDGVDIDYESLAAEDRDLFTLFIEELAAALHARNKELSIAVHAKTDDAGAWGGPAAQDWPRLAAAVDRFKIMTYDYRGAWSGPGPIAPYPWVDQVIAYAASQIPPHKIMVGVAFYGYDWNTTAGPPAKALRYSDVLALLRARGLTPSYDATAQSQTFVYWDNGQRHEVWYEDRRSVAAKAALVGQYGLAGAAGWRLGQEDPGVWEVFRMLAAGR